jgi:hypothetical protein
MWVVVPVLAAVATTDKDGVMPTRRHPDRDIDVIFDENAAVVTERQAEAAGVNTVMVSQRRGLAQICAVRLAAALNQRHGFDCPEYAWPQSNTPVSQAIVIRIEPWAG